MDEEPRVEAIVAAIEENVNGLWGAAQVGTATWWCQGKRVLVRAEDGSTDGWRAMTPEDVEALYKAFAIDKSTWARQHTRVLR